MGCDVHNELFRAVLTYNIVFKFIVCDLTMNLNLPFK